MSTDYGIDFLWNPETFDIDPNFLEVSGVRVVQQDIIKRLIVAEGTVFTGIPQFEDNNFGYSIPQLIGEVLTPTQILNIKFGVQNEILKDERVKTCSCVATYQEPLLTIAISCVLIQNEVFTLVFNLTENSIQTIILSP